MAGTGLFLVTFLFVHLGINLFILANDGGEAFNTYAHFMATAGIVRPLEVGLFIFFGLHIYQGLALTFANKAARPVAYATSNNNPKVSWFSKNMALSGTIVLFFLIVHLVNLWIPAKLGYMEHTTLADGTEVKDMFTAVVKVFKHDPLSLFYTALYLVGVFLLALHLQHGFQSAFKTLGLYHVKYNNLIQATGTIIAFGVPALFALIPLGVWFLY